MGATGGSERLAAFNKAPSRTLDGTGASLLIGVCLRLSRGCGQAEFLRDLGGADRRADLGEQPLRLAKLALAACLVIAEPCELRTLEVYEWLRPLIPAFPRGAKRVFECGFDRVTRLEAVCSQQHS